MQPNAADTEVFQSPDLQGASNFVVALPNFEGPLDLLLHLCRSHELDILNLPIAFITEKYLEYINFMETLNLDVASEYLVMAATLAHIKSKLLLPQPPTDQDDPEEEGGDPREELIRRLLEYQKYKHAAQNLEARPIEGRDVFARGSASAAFEGERELARLDVFRLIGAFQQIAKRRSRDIALEVDVERISIAERMSQLTELLCARKGARFEELFESAQTNYDVVVTFLALLEMAKMKVLLLSQADPHAALYLHYRVDGPAEIDMAAVEQDFAASSLETSSDYEQGAHRDSMILPSGSHEIIDEELAADYKEPSH